MELINLNLTVLENMPTINTSIVPNTSASFLSNAITYANNITNGYLGYLMLITLSIILYITLSDKTPYGDFNYDDSRAITISLGVSAIIGINMIEINFITSLVSVGFMISCYIFAYIYNIYVESKSEQE